MFGGQVSTGVFVSVTVTMKPHVPVRPCEFVAKQLIVVVPTGKVWREVISVLPILHVGVMGPSQTSLALTKRRTTAEHWPVSLLTAMFAGQVSTGAFVSVTVTVKLLV